MRRWRKMTWVLLVWCAVILAWAVAGGASAAHDCVNQSGSQFLSTQDTKNACDAGAGIGILLILFIGFVGFVFLSIIWFMTKPKGRDCPICGELVRVGWTRCQGCGHDFASFAPGTIAPG